jgi:predicted O-methyltransferase YrrM
MRVTLRRRLHGLRRLFPAGPRRHLSRWLRRRGFRPDAHYSIRIEYPTSASNSPRWNPHPKLKQIIAERHDTYRRSLETIAGYREALLAIDMRARDQREPSWTDEWLPALDGAAIYAFIRSRSPALYLEIGSGTSTKFAARARRDGGLDTRIVSIDPQPRAEIDELCDRALRVPLEAADLSVFDDLSGGDVVFFDGTHRAFMNSDATVFFLEVLPRLAAGVLVGVHDVFLPYDYPAEFADRYYSEQYLLAAHLLAGNPALEPVLPTYYATRHPELRAVTGGVWSDPRLEAVEPGGHAFWVRTRAP